MDEKKYTLDDIETLRSKTGVGYEEAVSLLEKYDGDIARALVELEKRGRLGHGNVFSGFAANRGRAEDFFGRWWRLGCETRIIVERGGEQLINLSALFMLLAIILGWKLMLIAAVLALATNCRVRVRAAEAAPEAEGDVKAEAKAEEAQDEDKPDDQDGYHTITIE